MLGRNGRTVGAAPVALVFAADTQPVARLPRLLAMEREHGSSEAELEKLRHGLELFGGHEAGALKRAGTYGLSPLQPMPTINTSEAWAFKQTMPAVQTLLLGAAAAGLATCPMEGFDGRRVRAALAIPERFAVPVIVALGEPAPPTEPEKGGSEMPPLAPSARLPLEEVFFRNAFGDPLAPEQLQTSSSPIH